MNALCCVGRVSALSDVPARVVRRFSETHVYVVDDARRAEARCKLKACTTVVPTLAGSELQFATLARVSALSDVPAGAVRRSTGLRRNLLIPHKRG